MMRGILRQLLGAAGYNVFTADSAETAVDIFSANEIVLTLTDIKMSGRDGLQLLDQIKSVDEDAIVPCAPDPHGLDSGGAEIDAPALVMRCHARALFFGKSRVGIDRNQDARSPASRRAALSSAPPAATPTVQYPSPWFGSSPWTHSTWRSNTPPWTRCPCTPPPCRRTQSSLHARHPATE